MRKSLLTAADRKRLPALYANENVQDQGDVIVHVRLFSIASKGTWWLTEIGAGEDADTAFGYVDIGMTETPELGYISIAELESVRFGAYATPAIERDAHFQPKTWREVCAEENVNVR